MNEEKYAYIKLVSGEEIFAQVEEFVDEDKCLVAFDPCFIKELPVKRGATFFPCIVLSHG